MGNLYLDLNRLMKPSELRQGAIRNSGDNYTEGMRLYTKLFLCDWRDLETSKESLLSKLRIGKSVTTPFPLLAVPLLLPKTSITLCCMRLRNIQLCRRCGKASATGTRNRIAYLSSNFREHAMSHLMAGLFEAHDRSNFETTAMSFGRNDGSKTRERIEASFDCFLDIDRL